MVERMMAQGEWLVTGTKMTVIKAHAQEDGLDAYRKTPEQIQQEAKEKGADVIFGF